ncbi:MAG: HEAT repeat domain-containing protein [Polyangiales bacterium]
MSTRAQTMRATFGESPRLQHLLWLGVLLLPLGVHADTSKIVVVYDQKRGELSPGTQAPSLEEMMNSIRSASPTALTATLEYGERVECTECIPLLEGKLLDGENAKVREMAAWWLRQRPFGYGRAAVRMREVVAQDQDPVRRSRAAEALGEFLDVAGLPALEHAAMEDSSAAVRLSAVRALGRLNAREGQAVIAASFEDADPTVRSAALDQVLLVNGFGDSDAVLARLKDGDGEVRMKAAQLAGQMRLLAGRDDLVAVLAGDKSAEVRQAAAWALGRIGGAAADLRTARDKDSDPSVQDAIAVALQMSP